jgi:DNA-binding transcriptional regulator YdaS (Cro superfamily)
MATGIEKAVAIAGSQSALARLLLVAQARVSDWVTLGYVPASRGRAEMVAQATGVSLKSLLRKTKRRKRRRYVGRKRECRDVGIECGL